MAGRIKDEDVEAVKERADLEEIVRERVTLRGAGYGSLKGLCPFHDEKTPSFNVRPSVGAWHCFGCGKGGDVITFVQEIDHLTFVEAIERLAAKYNVELHYEEGSRPRGDEAPGRRLRLVEAHRVAEEFYAGALMHAREARAGRDFLRGRDFDARAAEQFGVGYAPRAGQALTDHLRGKGFSDDELVLAGLSGRNQRGLYDRFRGRLVWPIRDITGDTVGFGARRLFEDDRIEAKYLNTSETPIYKKTSVLYGLDLAKKAISLDRQAVVVEGYTDVMACHLAGVPTAVATCGTAFGPDHIKVLRRILRDEQGGAPARTIFTFDGDAAGQKAAMRAFQDDQKWAGQSYVAVAPGGQDPCELRMSGGPTAVQGLIEDAVPMFEFAISTVVRRFDLDHAEGRIGATRAAAPVLSGIRDEALRREYERTVAARIGVDDETLRREVYRAAHAPAPAQRGPRREAGQGQISSGAPGGRSPGAAMTGATGGRPGTGPAHGGGEAPAVENPYPAPDLRHPHVALASQLLQLLLQHPTLIASDDLDAIPEESFVAPTHRAIFAAVRTLGRAVAAESSSAGWVQKVTVAAPEEVRPVIVTLSVAPILARREESGEPELRFVDEIVFRMREIGLARAIDDATVALRRAEGHDPTKAREIAIALTQRQRDLAALRERYA